MAKGNSVTTPPEGDHGNSDEAQARKQSTRVKYLGANIHRRVLLNKDFENAGIESVGKQVWSVENNHIIDFSESKDSAAIVKFLTESPALKGEFKTVDAGEL